MARIILTVLAVFVAIFGAISQLHFKPILTTFGLGRVIEEVGNKDCKVVPELQACEKITLHRPTGVLYLACSTPQSRTQWTPPLQKLNASGRSLEDYIATYDPRTSRVTRLKLSGLPKGISVHGMDVVPSSSNSNELFVYLVNHQPFEDQDPAKVGANSTIEILKTEVGGSTLTHMHTIHHPVIISPNDLVGSSDGKSFHFTNDAGAKVGIMKHINILLRRAVSSIGYCHVDEGCKFATPSILEANGIASVNDTFYVANALIGTVTVLERQSDNSLVLTDVIPTDRVLDNVSIDEDGMVWVAALSNLIKTFKDHFPNPQLPSPSSALRVSLNTGQAVFYGHKFKVEKVFEDSGAIASGVTSVVHDAKRGRLFLHGLSSPQLVVCNI